MPPYSGMDWSAVVLHEHTSTVSHDSLVRYLTRSYVTIVHEHTVRYNTIVRYYKVLHDCTVLYGITRLCGIICTVLHDCTVSYGSTRLYLRHGNRSHLFRRPCSWRFWRRHPSRRQRDVPDHRGRHGHGRAHVHREMPEAKETSEGEGEREAPEPGWTFAGP